MGGLLNLLARHQPGDRRVCRTVGVPSREEEDARHSIGRRETLQQDRKILTTELFGWCQIANWQLGALVAPVPAPYQSGKRAHVQGMTRAGNKHVRRLIDRKACSSVSFGTATCTMRNGWTVSRFQRRCRRLIIRVRQDPAFRESIRDDA